MEELEKYIKENPEDTLDVGITVLGEYYVRPITWCGTWKDNKLMIGNCLAYFNTREDAENELIEFGYELN